MDSPSYVHKDLGAEEWPIPRRFRLGAPSRPSLERSQRICPDLQTSEAFFLSPSERTHPAERTVPSGMQICCPYRWKGITAASTRQVNCRSSQVRIVGLGRLRVNRETQSAARAAQTGLHAEASPFTPHRQDSP